MKTKLMKSALARYRTGFYLFLISKIFFCISSFSSAETRVLSDFNSITFGDGNSSEEFWAKVALTQVQLAVKYATTPSSQWNLPQMDQDSLIIKPGGVSRELEEDFEEDDHLIERSLLKVNRSCRHAVNEILIKISNDSINSHQTFDVNDLLMNANLLKRKCFKSSINSKIETETNNYIFEEDYPKPVFHCNQYNGKNDEIIANFRMEYSDNLGTLRTLITDKAPIYFLVEIRMGNEENWRPIALENNWLFSVKVKTNVEFQLRVTSISLKYVYDPVSTKSITIYDTFSTKERGNMNLQVVNISISEENRNTSASALIRWTPNPSSDYQASCQFDLFYMDEDDVKKVKRRSAEDAFWVRLHSLKFNNNYNVRVIEKLRGSGGNGGKESEIISPTLRINVPSCLDLNGLSFQFCSPPRPTNLRLVNATDSSFWIQWTAPKYSNIGNNSILYYNISVEWIYNSVITAYHPYPNYNTLKILDAQVPGNVTSVQVQNVTEFIRGQFNVLVKAIGPVGASRPAWKLLIYKGSPEQVKTNQNKTWTVTADRRVFTLVVAGLIASFLSLLLLHMGIICILQRLPQHQDNDQGNSTPIRVKGVSSSYPFPSPIPFQNIEKYIFVD